MTLMLVDAASLYFRAFYGVPPTITAPDGTPTNAARGFLDMIATLFTRYRPSHFVACLDLDWRPAWRVQLLPTYKTHRVGDGATGPVGGAPAGEAEPPELGVQVPIILDSLAALGLAAFGAPEHEADDVVATLATTATMPVEVVTGDRDLFQLVDDARSVRVLYTGRGVAKLEEVTDSVIVSKYGVHAEQYADYATLRGDPSDGLPGVAGIGPKSAASLLTKYGSLDGVLAAVRAGDSSLGTAGRKLAGSLDYLEVAPAVVAGVRDLDLPNVDTSVPSHPADPEALLALDERWGIGNALARVVKTLPN